MAVEKELFVNQLVPKMELKTVFVIKYLNVAAGKDGREFLNVILADATGDVEARKWSLQDFNPHSFARGDYVLVQGKTNFYQNRLQVIIQEMAKVNPQDYQQKDFIPHSAQDPAQAMAEIKNLAASIQDAALKDIVQTLLDDPTIQRRLLVCPAGRSIHHIGVGGLAEHILSCAQLGAFLADFYHLDRDYVLAGTILHDLGKIYEFSEDDLVDYTDEGKLLGHIVKILELVDTYFAHHPDFPAEVKLHLKHILAAHHGELDCGSPKVPQTPEAYLVHLIDYLDSKIDTMKTALRGSQGNDWISYHKALDRAIYRRPLPHAETRKASGHPAKAPGNAPLKQSLADKLKDVKIDK